MCIFASCTRIERVYTKSLTVDALYMCTTSVQHTRWSTVEMKCSVLLLSFFLCFIEGLREVMCWSEAVAHTVLYKRYNSSDTQQKYSTHWAFKCENFVQYCSHSSLILTAARKKGKNNRNFVWTNSSIFILYSNHWRKSFRTSLNKPIEQVNKHRSITNYNKNKDIHK